MSPNVSLPKKGNYAIASKGVIDTRGAVVNYLAYLVPLIIVYFCAIVATMILLTGNLQGYVVAGESIFLCLASIALFVAFRLWRKKVLSGVSLPLLYDLEKNEFLVFDGEKEFSVKANEVHEIKTKINRWFCPFWRLFWLREKDLGNLILECAADGKKKTIIIKNINQPGIAKVRAEMMLAQYRKKEAAKKEESASEKQ